MAFSRILALIPFVWYLSACDTFRVRISDVRFRETVVPVTFDQIVQVATEVAQARGFKAEACLPNFGERCRAFRGPVFLEVYSFDAGARMRVVDTSAVSIGEPIEAEISRKLSERFGRERVEIVEVNR